MNRQQFYEKPKIRALPKQERARRWRQHQLSKSGATPGNRRTTRAATREVIPAAAALHSMPPCSIYYTQALEAPFTLTADACIPDLHAVASKKLKVITRFNFSTGTNGFGFCIVNPHCKANNAEVAIVTEPIYEGNGTLDNASVPGVISVAPSKIPYIQADFAGTSPTSDGVKGRVVGTGLRIRYIGPTFAESGQIVAIRQPDNQDLTGNTLAAIKQYATTHVYPVNKTWTYVNYKPVEPAEYEYTGASKAATFAGNNIPKWFLGCVITGTTTSVGSPSPAPFEGEIVQFIEYNGLVNNVTKTHSDIVGMSHIRNNTSAKSSTKHPHKRLAHTLSAIGQDVMTYGAPAAVAGVGLSKANEILTAVKSSKTAQTELTPALKEIVSGSLKEAEPSLFEGAMAGADAWLGDLAMTIGGGLEEALPMMAAFL